MGISNEALRRWLPELTLVILAVIWGGTFLATQTILQTMGPFTLLTLRFFLGACTLVLITSCRSSGWRPTREEAGIGFALGFVLFACYGGQTVALGTIDSSLSAFLTAAGAPLVAILQAKILRRSPAGRVWAAAVVTAIGVSLMGSRPAGSTEFGTPELLTLASAGAGALHVVLVGRWADRFDPARFTMVQLATVAALSLPAALSERPPTPSPMTIGLIAFMGIIATGIVLALMTWAQKTVEPARAVLIYALEPVFAGMLGMMVGERIGGLAFVGGALVVAAMIVGEWPERSRRWQGPDSSETLAISSD